MGFLARKEADSGVGIFNLCISLSSFLVGEGLGRRSEGGIEVIFGGRVVSSSIPEVARVTIAVV